MYSKGLRFGGSLLRHGIPRALCCLRVGPFFLLGIIDYWEVSKDQVAVDPPCGDKGYL